MKRLIYSLLLLAASTCSLLSQQRPTPGQHGAPLGKFLSPEGSLLTPPGFSGNLDPNGWRLTSGRKGEPRFIPEGQNGTSVLADTA